MQTLCIFILAAFSLGLGGCGGSASPAKAPAADTAGSAAHRGEIKPIGEAQLGDRSTCPVSGEEFVVTEHSPRVLHEGKTYYFCCPGCVKKFEADPQKYLSHSRI